MRGLGLAAMDEGWNGRPGASDPYLRAVCGKQASSFFSCESISKGGGSREEYFAGSITT
jgi:hypothetical protein